MEKLVVVRRSLNDLAESLLDEIDFEKKFKERFSEELESIVSERIDHLDIKDDVVDWLSDKTDLLDTFLEENKKLIRSHLSQVLYSDAMLSEFKDRIDGLVEEKVNALLEERSWWGWLKKCFA